MQLDSGQPSYIKFLKMLLHCLLKKHHPTLPDAPLYAGEDRALNQTETLVLMSTSRLILPGFTTLIL